jgi:hypothetical protein
MAVVSINQIHSIPVEDTTMASKQTQALARLVKKLSALRATLRKDERDLLDQLILGEVAGHGMASAKASRASAAKAAEVAGHGMSAAKASAAKASQPMGAKAARVAEVEAHGMSAAKASAAKASQPASALAGAKAAGAAEVEAHGMSAAKASQPTGAKAARASAAKATEVAGHAMSNAKASAAAASAIRDAIEFDSAKSAYKVTARAS